jgi:2-C-methyl-D-erythritol 4-phosphate cytidylyltransferase
LLITISAPGGNGVWAVIAAAGEGRRLGLNRPKAFAPLGNRVLLAESVERLEETEWIDGVVVVVPEGWEEPAILLAEELGAAKVTAVVAGGATRAASVRVGVAEVPADAAVIVVHDAARPLVSEGVVGRVLTALNDGWEGAVPGLEPSDTVKRIARGGVEETLPRERLRLVQTPQAFLAAALREALESIEDASDCAAMVEARGGRVAVVEGDRRLLKVTDAEDLALVSTWLGVAPALPIPEDEFDDDEDDEDENEEDDE